MIQFGTEMVFALLFVVRRFTIQVKKITGEDITLKGVSRTFAERTGRN
jgi:hypothetical protein